MPSIPWKVFESKIFYFNAKIFYLADKNLVIESNFFLSEYLATFERYVVQLATEEKLPFQKTWSRGGSLLASSGGMIMMRETDMHNTITFVR